METCQKARVDVVAEGERLKGEKEQSAAHSFIYILCRVLSRRYVLRNDERSPFGFFFIFALAVGSSPITRNLSLMLIRAPIIRAISV